MQQVVEAPQQQCVAAPQQQHAADPQQQQVAAPQQQQVVAPPQQQQAAPQQQQWYAPSEQQYVPPSVPPYAQQAMPVHVPPGVSSNPGQAYAVGNSPRPQLPPPPPLPSQRRSRYVVHPNPVSLYNNPLYGSLNPFGATLVAQTRMGGLSSSETTIQRGPAPSADMIDRHWSNMMKHREAVSR